MPDIITRTDSGEYKLSDYGQFRARSNAIKHILNHYLQKGMKVPPDRVAAVIKGLDDLLQKEFQSLEDYLNKLDRLADFIEEPNKTRFATFVGKNFIPTLEKAKTSLFEKELPKYRDRHENPYRTPSNDVLDEFEEAFQKASPLKYPDDGSDRSGQLVADLSADGSQSENAAESREHDTPAELPGVRISEELADEFNRAQPLEYPPGEGRKDNPGLVVDLQAGEQGTSQASEGQSDEDKTPGQIMLEQFGADFEKSPAYNAEGDQPEQNVAETAGTEESEKISLRDYATILGKVNRFMKTKDQQGYASWYSTLDDISKAVLNLNSQITKAAKGAEVDLDDVASRLDSHSGFVPGTAARLKNDIIKHRRTLQQIKGAMQKAIKAGADPKTVNSLYGQLVTLLGQNDSVENRKTQLKMMLLPINSPEAKNAMESVFTQLLDAQS